MQWFLTILILPYLSLILKIFRGLGRIKYFHFTHHPSTFVSVVIACRNEEKNLPGVINHILSQDYPKNLYELIIVDDNSNDMTYQIASGFKGTGCIITVYNKGIGKKNAIRTGVEVSSGDLIITTDADCMMGKKWISTIAAFYEKHKPDLIVCPVQIEPSTGFFGAFQELEFLSLQAVTAGSILNKEGVMCNGANLSFTKDTFNRHKEYLHNEIVSGDDIFMLHSLKTDNRSNILWLDSDEAIVITKAAPSLFKYLMQRKRWISKVTAYSDLNTISLGIVTFVTILFQVALLVASLFNSQYLPVFLIFSLVKSIPDYLILKDRSKRYGKKGLMRWFFPTQIIYPFYVLIVAFYAVISKETGWNINSPSQKET
jgi:glycosyltransferase involved in cell wall biosynthesis